MRMVRGMETERLCYQMVTCMLVNIVMDLGMAKESTYLKTVPDITVIGETDRNTGKGSFGTLMERDTKVWKNVQK